VQDYERGRAGPTCAGYRQDQAAPGRDRLQHLGHCADGQDIGGVRARLAQGSDFDLGAGREVVAAGRRPEAGAATWLAGIMLCTALLIHAHTHLVAGHAATHGSQKSRHQEDDRKSLCISSG